jgi:hypothetical protein
VGLVDGQRKIDTQYFLILMLLLLLLIIIIIGSRMDRSCVPAQYSKSYGSGPTSNISS